MGAIAKVVVVGGGPAGLAAACELASRGISCAVLERKDEVGGRARELSCKGDRRCRDCDVCRAHRNREEALRSEAVAIHTGVELDQVERNNGRYRFDVHRPKDAIDAGRCSRCGKCVEACPTGAMAKVGGRIMLDRSKCRSIQGLECERCVSVCPTGAIDLFGEERLCVNGDAVIVATGAKEFPAETDVRLGCGTVPGVVTSMDLESYLEGRSTLDLANGKKMAFILCVGSRSGRVGTSICSSVCCKYSLRQALALRERHPSLSIAMFIMDWRGVGAEDRLLRELAATDIRVIRSRPAEVLDEGRPTVRYASKDSVLNEVFDLVVLAVGLIPDLEDDTAAQLALPRDEAGNLVPGPLRGRGIFLAGSCAGPKDIRHCVADGIMAARQAAEWLEGDHE